MKVYIIKRRMNGKVVKVIRCIAETEEDAFRMFTLVKDRFYSVQEIDLKEYLKNEKKYNEIL